jgi:hypothetical protein
MVTIYSEAKQVLGYCLSSAYLITAVGIAFDHVQRYKLNAIRRKVKLQP